VTFVLPLPNAVGTHSFHFKGLEHNVSYFGAVRTEQVPVATTVDGNGLAFVSVTPSEGTPGQQITPTVRVRNIGTTTWGPGYLLNLIPPTGAPLPPRAMGSPAVPPQGEVDVTFSDGITLPIFEGEHTYRIKGEQQGSEYFGETTFVIRTTGASPGPQPRQSTAIGTTQFTAQWEPIPGVTRYRMDVATSWNFAPATLVRNNLDAGSGDSHTVDNLQPATEYFIRLRAESGAGTGPNGPTQRTETYGVNDIWLDVASDGAKRFEFRLGAGGSIADAFSSRSPEGLSSGLRFMSAHEENDTDGVWGFVLRARGLNVPGAGEFNINLSGGYSNRLRGDDARVSRIMEVAAAPGGVEIYTVADRQWEQEEQNFAEGKFSAYVRYETINDGAFKILKVRNVVLLGAYSPPAADPDDRPYYPQNVHFEASWMAFDSSTGMGAYGGRDRGKPIGPNQYQATDFALNGTTPVAGSYHNSQSHYNSHVGWAATQSQGFYVAFNEASPAAFPALAIVFGNKELEKIQTLSGTVRKPGQTTDPSKHALDVKHWDQGFALLPVLNLEKNTEIGGVIDYTYYLIGDAYLSQQLLTKVEEYARGNQNLVPVQRFYGPGAFPEAAGTYTGSDPLKVIVNKLKLNMASSAGDRTIHPSLVTGGGSGGGGGGGVPQGGHYEWQKVGEHTEVQKIGEHTELQIVGTHVERQKVGEHVERQAVGEHNEWQVVGQHTERQVVGQHTEWQVVGQHTETVVVGQHTETVVVGQHTEMVVVGQHTEMVVVGQHEESYTDPDTGETSTWMVDDYGEVTVDDYGEITVDDYGEITVDDYGEVTVDDYGEVVVDDYGDVTVDDYGWVTVIDYADVVVEDFADVVVNDYATVVIEDFGEVVVDDYDWVWVPDP
jgi:hypothetical protein